MDTSRRNSREQAPRWLNVLVAGAGMAVGPWLTWWHYRVMSTPDTWPYLAWEKMNGQMGMAVTTVAVVLAALIGVTRLRGRVSLLVNAGTALLWVLTAVLVGTVAAVSLDPGVPGCEPEGSCHYEFGAALWMLLTLVHWAALTGILAAVVLGCRPREGISAAG